ncbi:YcfA family protein [Stanieria cyanosphaera PCC 7437]|uniref:YcfA family protein n=1 Tax=Stanieria cyanosphaera (strain ATCC 29371 / PCC 7437) TaxID=111780 RepID=K9XV81_STAC7|nr:type II toxin-antitoxin system HicA family toxin [Stanieria cyanosphaera]AFZ35974.1 YcfA family protein [Stanieria cyanosphaera PCC 7437]
MPKLPRVTSTEAIKALEKLGFAKVRQKGSHVIMKKHLSNGDKTQIGCVIPLHNKTLAVGTLKSILNQANVSVDEFIQAL